MVPFVPFVPLVPLVPFVPFVPERLWCLRPFFCDWVVPLVPDIVLSVLLAVPLLPFDIVPVLFVLSGVVVELPGLVVSGVVVELPGLVVSGVVLGVCSGLVELGDVCEDEGEVGAVGAVWARRAPGESIARSVSSVTSECLRFMVWPP